MARRSGLGKGLGALIPSDIVEHRTATLVELPVAALEPNPNQPRQHFDEDSLAALTASIREVGVLQPVLVRRVEGDRYELIAGERRWRSAKRAGLLAIPAVVRETDDLSSLEQALVENLHRQDLNPLEEAAAYQQLLDDFGLTHEQLSRRVGKSRAAISNTLRLFQLPPTVQKLVGEGQLSAGHARALLGTPDRAFQEALARRIVTEQLSVRAVEEAVRARNELGGANTAPDPADGSGPSPRGTRLRPPGVLELEELLSEHLATRVRVDVGGSRGKVVIEFATLEDLERIYRAMTNTPDGTDGTDGTDGPSGPAVAGAPATPEG
ncbi:MAG TPA: ParB/RepB/Spo0J family partition protein [Acidimicrobiales bacterium]|nr:ParB/RepB/Spo0J family partition protein [Acidimicrobiales bacterium]